MIYIVFLLLVFTFSQVYEVSEMHDEPNGVKGRLRLSSSRKSHQLFYPPDIIDDLTFQFFFETKDRLRLKITDTNKDRWEVPDIVVSKTPETKPKQMNYKISVVKSPFSFSVTRVSDGQVVFNTQGFDFFFADQYIKLSTDLTTKNPHIYGLGERVHNFRLSEENSTYVIFNKDHGTPVDDNLYGTHPFYMQLLDNGNAHGAFFLNSNAQEFNIMYNKMSYTTIGGVIDMFFFMGSHPKDVVKQYHEVIGKPIMIPYWSLGSHQCRWGYENVDQTKEVVETFKKYDIPLETMWNDIDYMDSYKDFTLDGNNFPKDKMQDFISYLNGNNQHYINIIDPAIKQEKGYEAFDLGNEKDVWIKKSDGKTPLSNKVWPGLTYYPDFTNENTVSYWEYLLTKYLDDVPLSGVWIDMNEVSGFCDGECSEKTHNKTRYNGKFDPVNPPYTPGGANLNEHTISMDAISKLGVEYNVHSLYGFKESVVTHDIVKSYTKKRPFIITRSTFAGSGRYVGHWLGDNNAAWDDLRYSISGCLSMSMFGISTCGADICGFGGDTTPELCARWYEVGAFYTFMRNHNTKGAKSQEPYALGDDVVNSAKNSLKIRYELLPYFYTELFKAHTEAEMVMRALIFEFPSDSSNLLPYIDTEFLLGGGLLISPVMKKGKTTRDMYVPNALWYNYYTGAKLNCEVEKMCTVSAPLTFVNLHVRGGYIIPRKQAAYLTKEVRETPYNLIVGLDKLEDGVIAKGDLFIDDGVSADTVINGNYSLIEFTATFSKNSIIIEGSPKTSSFSKTNTSLEKLHVYGLQGLGVKTVKINGIETKDYEFKADLQVLTINNLNLNVIKNFNVQIN